MKVWIRAIISDGRASCKKCWLRSVMYHLHAPWPDASRKLVRAQVADSLFHLKFFVGRSRDPDHHRHRPGRAMVSRYGNSTTPFASNHLLRRPVELVEPHPMQDHVELSSDGNLGFAQAAALRKPDPPNYTPCTTVPRSAPARVASSRNKSSRPADRQTVACA